MGNKPSRSLAWLVVVLRATVAIVTLGAAIEDCAKKWGDPIVPEKPKEPAPAS